MESSNLLSAAPPQPENWKKLTSRRRGRSCHTGVHHANVLHVLHLQLVRGVRDSDLLRNADGRCRCLSEMKISVCSEGANASCANVRHANERASPSPRGHCPAWCDIPERYDTPRDTKGTAWEGRGPKECASRVILQDYHIPTRYERDTHNSAIPLHVRTVSR